MIAALVRLAGMEGILEVTREIGSPIRKFLLLLQPQYDRKFLLLQPQYDRKFLLLQPQYDCKFFRSTSTDYERRRAARKQRRELMRSGGVTQSSQGDNQIRL